MKWTYQKQSDGTIHCECVCNAATMPIDVYVDLSKEETKCKIIVKGKVVFDYSVIQKLEAFDIEMVVNYHLLNLRSFIGGIKFPQFEYYKNLFDDITC